MDDLKLKRAIRRGVRGFIAGGIATIVPLATFSGGSLRELYAWIAILGFGFISGGIGGFILAVDKYIRDGSYRPPVEN